MKFSSLRFLPLLLWTLWPTANVNAQGSPPSPDNSGNPGCGNSVPPGESPKCNECGAEGEGSEFEPPCPSTDNPVHSFNGNAQHIIPDLKIAGSVGSLPLEFSRYSATRLSNRNLITGSFGKESSWSHTYDWVMRDAGGTLAQPRISVTFPEGKELVFVKPLSGASVWFSTLASRGERLTVTSNDYTVTTAELKSIPIYQAARLRRCFFLSF